MTEDLENLAVTADWEAQKQANGFPVLPRPIPDRQPEWERRPRLTRPDPSLTEKSPTRRRWFRK